MNETDILSPPYQFINLSLANRIKINIPFSISYEGVAALCILVFSKRYISQV